MDQEVINDIAKLIIHRLVSRALARAPTLVNLARASNARQGERYPDREFVQDWSRLLLLPLAEIRSKLTSRDPCPRNHPIENRGDRRTPLRYT